MSIGLLFTLDNAQLDGATRYPFDADQWTLEANNQFSAELPAAQNLGIIDLREVLQGLTNRFGRFLEPVAPDVGSVVKLTDLVAERAIVVTGGQTTQEWGTHSRFNSGGATGRRLRQGPAMMATESAGVFQAGGVGQVSHTLFANGQAGVMMVPTGDQVYVESDAAAGALQFAIWTMPIYAPRDIGKFVQAGQPPAQFA